MNLASSPTTEEVSPTPSMSEDVYIDQPSLNVHVNLSEYWPQCSTLLVDVLPWCLMTNQSGVDLVVIETDGTTWQLPAKKSFSPPKCVCLKCDIALCHGVFYFYAPGSNDRGYIVFVLFVCLFVCCQLWLYSNICFTF